MSVVEKNEKFIIIDELKYFGNRMKPELFNILGKFVTDSQFSGNGRKRKIEVTPLLEKKMMEVADLVENSKVFNKNVEVSDNNLEARKLAKQILETAPLRFPMSSEQIVDITEDSTFSSLFCNNMISNWVRNSTDASKLLQSASERNYLIPPNSTFHIGDVTDVVQYSKIQNIKFDLVIADPPWMNKSVKRKKTYEMNEYVLEDLELEDILGNNCLVAFWITNRSGIREEVRNLFEKWHLKLIGEWKWLKVTQSGSPVYGFSNSTHKLPYEVIVFATRPTNTTFDGFPEELVFSSVPMAVHSHKPPIVDILKEFGYTFEKCLELFARNLLPNFTSVGFETLLLQSDLVYDGIV